METPIRSLTKHLEKRLKEMTFFIQSGDRWRPGGICLEEILKNSAPVLGLQGLTFGPLLCLATSLPVAPRTARASQRAW